MARERAIREREQAIREREREVREGERRLEGARRGERFEEEQENKKARPSARTCTGAVCARSVPRVRRPRPACPDASLRRAPPCLSAPRTRPALPHACRTHASLRPVLSAVPLAAPALHTV